MQASAVRIDRPVAYLTSQYPATSHTFIRREVAALRELGVDVQTFSIRPPGSAELKSELDREEAARTYTVLRQRAWSFAAEHLWGALRQPVRYLRTLALALRHRPPGLKALLLSTAHFAEAIVLAGELRRRRIGRLHNHFANSAATVGLLASHYLRLPWSFTMHGISETDYPAGLMLPAKIAAADLVICVSWFGLAQASRVVAPSLWSKLTVVRCGLLLDTLPQPTPPTSGPVRVICVGRLSAEKGHAGLLQAFRQMTDTTAELTLVGDGPERDQLEVTAHRLGLTDRVTFLGRLGEQETLAEIVRSNILVLPSFMEGLPIVLMEALALGLPVIASRVAGIPELIRDGENGFLFTPARWDELTRSLELLVDNPELRRALGVAGQQTVAEEFDVRKSAARLQHLYAERR